MNLRVPMFLVAWLAGIAADRVLRAVSSGPPRRRLVVVAALFYVDPRGRAYLRIGGLPYALDVLLHFHPSARFAIRPRAHLR